MKLGRHDVPGLSAKLSAVHMMTTFRIVVTHRNISNRFSEALRETTSFRSLVALRLDSHNPTGISIRPMARSVGRMMKSTDLMLGFVAAPRI